LSGIGVTYNPRSGHHRRDPRAVHRLARVLGPHGAIREVSSIDALYRVAEEFRRLDIDVLGISGGDGTSGVTIGAFLDVYAGQTLPRIALLRGGTANAIANSVGVHHAGPERLLERVSSAYLRGELCDLQRPVMRIRADGARRNDGLPTGATSYGFLFGTGVVSGYLRELYARGSPNARGAAATLLRAIGSSLIRGPMIRRVAEPVHGSVELDDGTTWPERDYLAIAAGTVEQIGLGFKPFYRALAHTDAFHILGIHARPLGFIQQLDRIWRGRAMRPGHTYEGLVKCVKLHARQRPLAYMIDGDLYWCDGGLEVTLGPVVRIVLVD
jgi:diacylglycerol kinase family enzyme